MSESVISLLRKKTVFIKNLPLKPNKEHLYELFQDYGPILQIWAGHSVKMRGTAVVIFIN